MDVHAIINEEIHQIHEEQKAPLLRDIPERNPVQQAISQTFQSTAHLANLLPTGTVMAFQLLSPIVTNQGECDTVSRTMTSILITLCGLSAFLLSFTDSFKNNDGNIYYGFATFTGLWVIDGSATLPPNLGAKYRLRFIDFLHAFLSVFVFAAIALFDKNTVQCFYPSPSKEMQEVLTALPVGIGVICSMLFVAFPTQRHGIGFPLTANMNVNVPLLPNTLQIQDRHPVQQAISQTFQSTAHLANLLPKGTVMANQFLPQFLQTWVTGDPVDRTMTSILITLFGLSSSLLRFSNGFQNNHGNIYYGVAMFNGLWVIDGSATLPQELDAKYCIRFIDFLHAFMSVLGFAPIALFARNTV